MRMCWVSSIFSSYVNSSFMASICRWGWLFFFFLSQKGTLTLFHPISWPKNPRRRRRNLQLCQHLQQNIDFSNPKTTDWVQPKKSQKKKNVTQIATTNIITSETCQANSTKKKCTTKTATQTTNRSYQDSNLTKSDSYSLCKLKNPLVAFFPCTKYMPNLAYLHLGPKILFCHWFGCAIVVRVHCLAMNPLTGKFSCSQVSFFSL